MESRVAISVTEISVEARRCIETKAARTTGSRAAASSASNVEGPRAEEARPRMPL